MFTKKALRKKYGIKKRPLGHGGARGSGSHLGSLEKDTSVANKREESRIKKQVMGQKLS